MRLPYAGKIAKVVKSNALSMSAALPMATVAYVHFLRYFQEHIE